MEYCDDLSDAKRSIIEKIDCDDSCNLEFKIHVTEHKARVSKKNKDRDRRGKFGMARCLNCERVYSFKYSGRTGEYTLI